ncbi:MAG: class I SAM-dependent methyltransferase [Deltaproteobacteria bacterium]|nr:class I SAM-dependent methyltransferase [Deltaproteobacteria bacterium]
MKILKKISNQTIKRYSERYNKLGYNVKTLGWGSDEQQEYRFTQTLYADLNQKRILDIGCGFGDYYSFIKKNGINIKKYTGWDINSDLIEEAERIHKKDTINSFKVRNVIDDSCNTDKPVADIGVMLGVLNFNLKDDFSNYDYSKFIIKKAFNLVTELLIVDFLSKYRTKSYPNEDFVFYHDPVKMLEFAMTLSNNVGLKHNYMPIPQKEFMLFIYK